MADSTKKKYLTNVKEKLRDKFPSHIIFATEQRMKRIILDFDKAMAFSTKIKMMAAFPCTEGTIL